MYVLKKKKKERIFERISAITTKLSDKLIQLNMQNYNNITATLTTSNNKGFNNCHFLIDFLNIHARTGVFCGPVVIYALARLYNVTVFLYTTPPLTESQLAFEGEIMNQYYLCMTKENGMGCTGLVWRKNIMVFNP